MWRLTNEQLIKLADIMAEVGMVAFGSAILPSISSLKTVWIIISLLCAFTFWYFSLLIIKIAKES